MARRHRSASGWTCRVRHELARRPQRPSHKGWPRWTGGALAGGRAGALYHSAEVDSKRINVVIPTHPLLDEGDRGCGDLEAERTAHVTLATRACRLVDDHEGEVEPVPLARHEVGVYGEVCGGLVWARWPGLGLVPSHGSGLGLG